MNKGTLSWSSHIERMDEERSMKKIYRTEVDGVRGRGRPGGGGMVFRSLWRGGVLLFQSVRVC